jgi:hypothetical protein
LRDLAMGYTSGYEEIYDSPIHTMAWLKSSHKVTYAHHTSHIVATCYTSYRHALF